MSKPSTRGRCQLAAEFLRSRHQLLLRLRSDRAGLFKGGDENQATPREGEDYLEAHSAEAPWREREFSRRWI